MKETTLTEQTPIKSYEVTLGKGLKVTKDAKSRTRVVNFPFEFPDETRGVMIICKIKDEEWIPSEDIRSINIIFNQS